MLVRRRRLGALIRRVALEADLACRCSDGDNSRVPAFPPGDRLAALGRIWEEAKTVGQKASSEAIPSMDTIG